MAPAIAVSGLEKRFGEVRAVCGVDFEVATGEVFGFLGPNGAGKSTTINMLCTLAKPSAGSAAVAGYDVVSERDDVRRHIGLVFQETTLDSYLSAAENLRLHAELYGVARPLPSPFMVLATQNPHEHAGTYPLPESQLDRFLLRLSVGYPAAEVERALLLGGGTTLALHQLEPVASGEQVRALQAAVQRVEVQGEIADYVLALVEATRSSRLLSLGASPRGALALLRVAQARALLRGRGYVQPDDVKELCVPCLSHRVVLAGRGAGGGEADRLAAERVVRDLAEAVPVPE